MQQWSFIHASSSDSSDRICPLTTHPYTIALFSYDIGYHCSGSERLKLTVSIKKLKKIPS